MSASCSAFEIEQLDQLVAFIAAQRKLRLIPGDRWAADPCNDAIMYPRKTILEMAPHEARGHLWRTVEHLREFARRYHPYTVAVDAALGVRDALGVNCVHPRWIISLFFHAERERATELASGTEETSKHVHCRDVVSTTEYRKSRQRLTS